MEIRSVRELSVVIRAERRKRGWSQQQLARHVGVGRDWIINLEKAKPTVELGLVLRTFRALDLAIHLSSPTRPAEPEIDLNEILENHDRQP